MNRALIRGNVLPAIALACLGLALGLSTAPAPAGFVISSAEDMGQYLIAHLNAGRYRSAQILSPAGIAELHRPAVLFLVVAPQLFGPLPLLTYVAPDLGYIMVVSSVVALGWSVLRTGLAYLVLHTRGAPIAVEASAA